MDVAGDERLEQICAKIYSKLRFIVSFIQCSAFTRASGLEAWASRRVG